MNRHSRSDLPVFDMAPALERLMQNRPLLQCAVNAFLEQSPRLLAELGATALRADAGGARHCAHTLKGSALTVGANQMAAIAGAMEQSAACGDMGEAFARLPALTSAFVRFRHQAPRDLR